MIVSLVLTVAIAFGSLAATLSLGWGPKLGLDLAGGLSVVYKPTTVASTSDMQEVVTILSNRVNGLGVSGAQVNLQGKDVVVSVPGVHDARKVLAIVGETAQLLFRPVLCQAQVGTKLAPLGKKTLPTCAAAYQMTETNLAVAKPIPPLPTSPPRHPTVTCPKTPCSYRSWANPACATSWDHHS